MRFVTKAVCASAARRLLAGASFAALALGATPALAQDADAASANGTAAPPQAEQGIVVTGTRITVPAGMESPVPVTEVQAEQLEAMDPSSLINSLGQLPQFFGNTTPNNSNFFTRGGTGNLNLRGLGPNRTLTLLNGRRMPASSAFGGVDINVFPKAMIKSIETVTGGASAAYGTDAVAGVVNFILDTDYTGIEADVQGGVTDRGDGENYTASLSFGTKLGDRGHLLLSGEIAEMNGIHSYKGRDWYRSWGSILDSSNTWRFYPDMHSMATSFNGIISAPGTPINGMQFDSSGNLSPFTPGAQTQGAVGTFGARTAGGDGDDINSQGTTVWPDTDRYSLFAYADYEVSSGIKLFGQYIRGHNHQFQYQSPQATFSGVPSTLTIYQDNAYLPASLRQQMIDNNIASFALRRTGALDDIGGEYYEDWTTQDVGTIGFDAEIKSDGFLSGWKINGYGQYGRSKRIWDQYGLRVDRIFAAVDAVDDGNGNVVCRISLYGNAFPGCQPLNLFGEGNASPGAIDYVLGNDPGVHVDTPLYFAGSGFADGITDSYDATKAKRNITTYKQKLAEVSANGTVFDNWAGPVSLAFGASYRSESVYQISRDTANPTGNLDSFHPVLCDGAVPGYRMSSSDCTNTVGFQFSKVPNIQGETKVEEAFAETLFPLISNGSWIDSASLNGAGRWAHYSGAGDVWSYKVGLDAGFFDTVRLRGTYSRDVRAGNLSERFNQTGGIASNLDDPRTPNVIEALQATLVSGGNPAIKPEKADTFTAGAVFQPHFIPGFSASVDWYQVHIKDAISTVGAQQVLNRCFLENAQEFCNLIVLDPNSGAILLVGDQNVNVARSAVEGVDAELDYRAPVKIFGGDEAISLRAFATWLITRSETNSTGVTTDYAGQTGFRQSDQIAFPYPKFKANADVTYTNGPFSLFVQGRYIGSGQEDPNMEEGEGTPTSPGVTAVTRIADNHVNSAFYVDLRLSYDFDIAGSNVELWGSVTNLFDKDPPVTPAYVGLGGTAVQVNTGLFDVLGRRYTIGLKVKI